MIACDCSEYATVEATVVDADGNVVADGTSVLFAILGTATASPRVVETFDGLAMSIITPHDSTQVSFTVVASSGDAHASIRIDCETPGPPCPDFNGDGRVTGRDVAAVARALRTQDPLYDVDGGGQITIGDVIAVVRQIGVECPVSPPLH